MWKEHFNEACDFSQKENLINVIKTKGYLKYLGSVIPTS